jgi:hypothetical protein
MQNKIILLLKISIAFTLLYPAIASLIDPSSWIGFAPSWIEYILPKELFLILFSVFEIFLALAILFLKHPFYPLLVATLVFFGVVIFNMGAMDIVFRDISIGLVAIALAMMTK